MHTVVKQKHKNAKKNRKTNGKRISHQPHTQMGKNVE
jgi:hypothetical protein